MIVSELTLTDKAFYFDWLSVNVFKVTTKDADVIILPGNPDTFAERIRGLIQIRNSGG